MSDTPNKALLHIDDSSDEEYTPAGATGIGKKGTTAGFASPIALDYDKDDDGANGDDVMTNGQCKIFHVKPILDTKHAGVEGIGIVVWGYQEKDICDIFFKPKDGDNKDLQKQLQCVRRVFDWHHNKVPVKNHNKFTRKLIIWIFKNTHGDNATTQQYSKEDVIAFFTNFIKPQYDNLLTNSKTDVFIEEKDYTLVPTWSTVLSDQGIKELIDLTWKQNARTLKSYMRIKDVLYSYWPVGEVPVIAIKSYKLKAAHVHTRDLEKIPVTQRQLNMTALKDPPLAATAGAASIAAGLQEQQALQVQQALLESAAVDANKDTKKKAPTTGKEPKKKTQGKKGNN